MKRLLCILLICVVSLAQADVTPDEYVKLLPKPKFKEGNRLPRLTTFSWPFTAALREELATNWNYALDIQDLVPENYTNYYGNTNINSYRLITLVSNYPTKFFAQGWTARTFPTPIPKGFYCTNAAGWFVDAYTNSWEYQTNLDYHKVISPEGDESYWEAASESMLTNLLKWRALIPVSYIMNGGEYGLSESGSADDGAKAWKFDARVIAIKGTNDWGGLEWANYASNRKAHQLGLLTKRVHQYFPDRKAYLYYGTGTEQTRWYHPPDVWNAQYGFNSDVMVTNTDYPTFENYHWGPWSWTNAASPPLAWNTSVDQIDILTKHLNAVGFNITLGYSNNYSFVNGGNSLVNEYRFAEIPRYTGFLKCLYTSGMVGAIGTYSVLPDGTAPSIFGSYGFTGSFPTNIVPHWIQQYVALSRVHAIFTHLDNFILDGGLLPGNGNHIMSQDQPSYEFTNTVADASARVLARKMGATNEWIITAWAAGGSDRNVSVTIPTLGSVTVTASDTGTVYRATSGTFGAVDEFGNIETASTVNAVFSGSLHINGGRIGN